MRISKFGKIFLGVLAFAAAFTIELIRASATLPAIATLGHECALATLIAVAYELGTSAEARKHRTSAALPYLRKIVIASLVALGIAALGRMRIHIASGAHEGYLSVIFGSAGSLVVTAVYSWMVAQFVALVLSRRKKETRAYASVLVVLIALHIVEKSLALDMPMVQNFIVGLIVIASILNAVRMHWVVNLSKREKLRALGLLAIVWIASMAMISFVHSGDPFAQAAAIVSPSLARLEFDVALFAMIYTGIGMFVVIFTLPTADAIDRRRIEVRSLADLTRLVSEAFDVKKFCETVVLLAVDVTASKAAWIDIHTPVFAMQDSTPDARHGIDHSVAHLLTTVLRSRLGKDVIVIDDVMKDERLHHEEIFPALREAKIRSLAIVPFGKHNEGALYVAKSEEFGFEEDDLNVLTAFAETVSISIDNAHSMQTSLEKERLQGELKAAQMMQKKLLPSVVPAWPSVEIAVSSDPAYEVGGDYYDFTSLADGRPLIGIGDVSGKGISAAFYMAEVKGVVQSLASSSHDVHSLVAGINRTLMQSLDAGSFITFTALAISREHSSIELARAGHCPALLVRTNGTLEEYRPNGFALGMVGNEKFSSYLASVTLAMTQGDVVILFTDGVTDARASRDGEEFGYEALCKAAAQACNNAASSQSIHDAIWLSLKHHTGAYPHDDDATLMVIRWK